MDNIPNEGIDPFMVLEASSPGQIDQPTGEVNAIEF